MGLTITGGVTLSGGMTLNAGDSLGPDLVTNGDFDTDSDWDKGGGWSISGGTASNSGWGPATNLTSNSSLSIVAGNQYEVTYTVSNYSSGTIKIFVGSTDTTGTARNANGTYTETHTAAGNSYLYIQGASNFVGSIDNISVRAVLS